MIQSETHVQFEQQPTLPDESAQQQVLACLQTLRNQKKSRVEQ